MKLAISDDLATRQQVTAVLLIDDLRVVSKTMAMIDRMTEMEAKEALRRVLMGSTHLTLRENAKNIVHECE